MKKMFLITLMSFSILALTFPQPSKMQVTLQLGHFRDQLAELRKLDVDIAGVDIKRNQVTVVVDDVDFLLKRNFKLVRKEFLIKEVDPGFKNAQEIESILKEYAAKYPAFTELHSIGKSLEGRDIWALQISNKSVGGTKPAFYMNGMHHAREVMTPEVPLDMIEYLLTNYERDAKVRHWVDSLDIWVVPMVNVDGNDVVWTKNIWWRKNTRGGYGVDLNRNYPYEWGGKCNGSSKSKSSDAYHGDAAASEPETQAVMNLVQKIRPKMSLSLHSFGELVLYPYGCEGRHTPDNEMFKKIGTAMAAAIPSEGEGTYTPGTPWEILYSVDGDDVDWMYSEYGVYPFVIEMNREFQPSYQTRDATVKKLRVAWMMLLDQYALLF